MSSHPIDSNPPLAELCAACGFCCNGVLFTAVELQPSDDPASLRRIQLPLRVRRGKTHFRQPCALWTGTSCQGYEARPRCCRSFQCLTFLRLKDGSITETQAQRIVRKARRQAAQVERLLRLLGCHQEELALELRFRRLSRRLSSLPTGSESAALFADLALAYYKLGLQLQQHFLP
jgi:hypothetical protein